MPAPIPLFQPRTVPSIGDLILGADDVMSVFAYHVYMVRGSLTTSRMGPKRRALIAAWVQVYDREILHQASEGFAADGFWLGENRDHRRMASIEHMLKDEARIEECAERGRMLRERAAKIERIEPERAQDPAAAAAARERIRALADQMRAR